MTDTMLGWHFLTDERRTREGDLLVRKGSVLRAEGPLVMCHNGMHASERAIDALSYAPGAIVERVELHGEILHGADKACARARKCLWWADATRVLHEFACWCAEEALKLVPDPDPRSLEAIVVKRRWLAGDATDAELSGAYDAAADAAYDVTCAATCAAGVGAYAAYATCAATCAAADAAYDVTCAATCAAGVGAYATYATCAAIYAAGVAGAARNARLTEMLEGLAP